MQYGVYQDLIVNYNDQKNALFHMKEYIIALLQDTCQDCFHKSDCHNHSFVLAAFTEYNKCLNLDKQVNKK